MEEHSLTNRTTCPICGAEAEVHRLADHIICTHLMGLSELYADFIKSVSNGFDDESKVRLTCLHCDASISTEKFAAHLVRVHEIKYEKSAEIWRKRKAIKQHHQVQAKTSESVKSKAGKMDYSTMAELLSRGLLMANSIERCDCGKQVVYAEMGNGKFKAFEVDGRKRIFISHICEGLKSESVYTLSGGAIDSNRRKH